MKKFIKNLIHDVAVNLNDEFDKNFERKAFFNEPWEQTKLKNPRGSLMMRSGNLRNGMRYDINRHSIRFTNSMIYAAIQNNGGTITVTAKMKRFFWAMYYKAAGAVSYSIKKKAPNNTKRNRQLNDEAAQWKAMALKKVGSKIKIPARPFIGNHPMVRRIIQETANANLNELNKELTRKFKQK